MRTFYKVVAYYVLGLKAVEFIPIAADTIPPNDYLSTLGSDAKMTVYKTPLEAMQSINYFLDLGYKIETHNLKLLWHYADLYKMAVEHETA